MDNPSSLIFVAIVVVWVGWFVQHQIRRREVLATVRTIDTFSEAMRVLERREPVGVLASAATRTSLRAGTVIHGEPGLTPAASSAPLSMPALLTEPSASVRVRSAHVTNEVAMTAHWSPSSTLRGAWGRVRPRLTSRRTRGITFLALLALLPVTLLLAGFGAASWLVPVADLMLLAAVVLWLRAEAVARQSRPTRRTAQPVRGQQVDVLDSPSPVAEPVVVRSDDTPFDGRPRATPTAPAASAPSTASPAAQPGRTAATASPAAPGTWSPMQVPKPTYTMKAKAPERANADAASTSPHGARLSSYAEMPVEELPFDGLALDPEADDLPSVFRAG